MDGVGGEGGEANGDVFSAFVIGCAVLNPFAGAGDDGLPCLDIKDAAFPGDAQHSHENDCVLVERGCLAGFDPTARTAHAGDAQGGVAGVHAADEFVDDLGFVACGLNPGG